MTVSVIICTRNRAPHLRETLASVSKTIIPQNWSVDFLVVDNGSTDSTPSIVEEARANLPSLRYLLESRPGLSNARNAGLEATSGEIILFTDDDVRVPRDWIEPMSRPIVDGEAEGVAGGVRLSPDAVQIMAKKSLEGRKSWVASTEALDPKEPGCMVGANMAFHRRVLTKVPSFDPYLGPGALGFGDETLFSLQLLKAGFRICGRLNIAVEHHFEISRLKEPNMLSAARKLGQSQAYIFHHFANKKSHGSLFRLIINSSMKMAITGCRQCRLINDDYAIHSLLIYERRLYFCKEYRRIRGSAPKYPISR